MRCALIDSTRLHLAGVGAQWARFSSDVFGAKAHVIYDPGLGRPVYHAVTAANVNDITAAKQMPIEKGATYVFDLGYYDFAWWALLDGADCRLVTRFTRSPCLLILPSLSLPPRECCFGTRPIQAEKSRPDRKAFGSATRHGRS
jgi:Transposase DDE domain